MKFWAILLALLAKDAVANKARSLRSSLRLDTSRSDENPCPDGQENHYKLDESYKIVGKNKLDSVWDVGKLREALAKEERWKIGEPWLLKATFTNNGNVPRKFGFQAGQDKGFLNIIVPAGCVECTMFASEPVLTSASHAEFQYRDEKPFTSGEVIMSNICLTPQVCKGFKCPHPQTQKLKANDTFGYSEAACCEPRMCKDEISCLPTTQWEPRKDFETRQGSTPQGCCVAKYCPADLCENITGWDKNPATGLKGSTKEECCIQKECLDWTCSDVRIMKKKASMVLDPASGKNVTVKGWGDVECCEELKCDLFEIPKELQSLWKLKDNATLVTGNSLSECGEPRLCGDFSCPNNTQYRPKNSSSLAGSTVEQCCETLLCSAYTCSNSTTMQKKVKPHERPGSTDEECCELKFCKDYKCSDSTKWIHISDQLGVTNIDRRGSSDEECCEEIFCRAETCSPSTMWKPKEKVEEVQGSSMQQCCEPIFCGNYTCDTDDDGDGDGTMWYKRVDTNTYKWQGSTNEECCLPKYCSQYTTSTPTQWKRKSQKNLQGSTDVECYEPLLCSDYCCVGAGWVKKPAAETRPGSTDEECCTKADLPDTHVKQVR